MIEGNTDIILQVRANTGLNEIGEPVNEWHDVITLTGWLDYMSGDAGHGNNNAKIQESTHIFVCDYKPVPAIITVNGNDVEVNAENARVLNNSQRYDVILIDNPMNLNRQLEIYLKFTGGQ